MVMLTQHDLEFILKQIEIAEAHAAGGDLAALVAGYNGNDGLTQAHLLPYGLRTVDGSYNNLVPGRENWGAADQSFPGIFTPSYLNDADGDRHDFGSYDLNGDGIADTPPAWYTNNDYGNAGTRSGSNPGAGSGTVIDADPRIISNLIVDQTLDNPAAIAAALTHAGMAGQPLMAALGEIVGAYKAFKALIPVGAEEPSDQYAAAKQALDAKLARYGVEMDGNTVFLPNVSPDEGLSSPFNGWMTIFGQFFDHGLDLVAKGGNGTVYVPLQPDDPLYVPGSSTNYIPLTRVTVDAGADGKLGTADDGPGPKNLTTPWVDQNQTYGSTASKQVFMRKYIAGPDGKPIATGHLLEGANGGLATWADIKHQAKTKLGIDLTDLNVGNIPLVAADAYGNFIPGANGYPQLVVGMGADGKLGTADDVLREGDPAAPVSAQGVVLTGHAFLDDIAHAAAPVVSGGVLRPDDDAALGYSGGMAPLIGADRKPVLDADGAVVMVRSFDNGRGGQTFYDNELLDRHFIAGDGRANENIALTAVHQVFHAEHNRIVEMTKDIALQSGDLAFLNDWLLVDVAEIPTTDAGKAALVWDGERLFQAGRFTNEMEYQHLVFEEFGRMMQPDIDAFVFEPSADINPSIAAEFAHVVYRFGHSMLRQDIGIIKMDENGKPVAADVTLFDGFLNPVMYDSLGSAEEASGAIIRGMSRQTGSEIDEFVTDVLRNQLLGVPLDLAAINLARGRDVGMPSLQTARSTFFEETGDTLLKPYKSWADFALNLKNPASIINFIAAYGTHETVLNTPDAPKTVEELRAAATLLVLGGEGAPADRLDFLNATGAYADDAKLGGLNDIDFWIGGLAEKKMAFGGMLGSTFSFVFQMTMENLQDADRFYYLSRTQGLNLLNELENNTFAELVMRNTDLGDEHSTALPGNVFSAFDMPTLELDISKQLGDDPVSDDPFLGGFSNLVERVDVDLPTGVTVTGMPQGMSFDPATLRLTGTAAEAGSYLVKITATYATGATRSHEVTIVAEGPAAPDYPAVDPIALTADHLDALVDDDYYLQTYTDVADAGMDADVHWVNHGAAEGRDPNAFFSVSYYLEQNPDVAASGVDPLQHYATIGWQQGRNPSAAFDVGKYLDANPDVANAGFDPLHHYLAFGRYEGRAIHAVEAPALDPVNADAGDSVVELAPGQAIDLKLPANFFRGDGYAEYLRVNSNEHFTIGGTERDDVIVSGGGDDAIWGKGGDDRIEAGYGVDKVFGGEGDDIITNAGTDIGEADFLHGNEGNDVIHGGSGLSLIFGNQGNDFIVTGPDGKEAFAGTGNDFVLGGTGGDFLLGNEGDDWMEGGQRFDTLAGDNSELFFNSTIIGHDVLNGGSGDTDYDGESGDDIMFQNSEGIQRSNGMAGFDWAVHKGDSQAANSNLGIPIFATQEAFILRDRFDLVEGLSGWMHNDVLTGRKTAVNTRAEIEGTAAIPGPNSPLDSYSNDLLAKNVALIDGLAPLLVHLGEGVPVTRVVNGQAVPVLDENGVQERIVFSTADASDILLGGGGSDVITGLAGNDIIDGDNWLNVRIRFVENGVAYTVDEMAGKVYREADYVNGAPQAGAAAQFGGRLLTDLMFDRTVNPGQLEIVREIVDGDVANTGVDIAVYTDVVENYTFTRNADGSITVDHSGFADAADPVGPDGEELPEEAGGGRPMSDGVDRLFNIEKLRFSDGEGGTIDYSVGQLINEAPTGAPVISDLSPTEGQALAVNTSGIADANGIASGFSYQWQASGDDGATWRDLLVNANGSSFTPNNGVLGIGSQVGELLRVRVGFTDGAGKQETLFSAATGVVGDDWNGVAFVNNVFNGTAGDDIADGVSPIFIGGNDTLNGNGGDDILNGAGGNDTLNGGSGDDRLDGGANTDVAVYAGAVANFALGSNGTNLLVTDLTGAEGTDTVSTVETLRFAGANYTVVAGSTANNTLNGANGANGSQAVFGFAGNDTLNGGAGADLLVGGLGNDVINGGADADTIYWTAGDGRDRMDGGAGTDTVKLVGDTGAETYRIYSRTAALAAGLTGLNANTEIVITRNGTNNASIIAELDNIEDIRIDGRGGGDTFIPIGDFTGTSLSYSTITIDGTAGDDNVDITALGSAHRVVFKSNGGQDTIVGVLRAQDVIELPEGAVVADYTASTGADGFTTLAGDTHSVRFMSDGLPTVVGFGEAAWVVNDAKPKPASSLYTRPGTQDGSAASADVLAGPDGANSFYFDVEAASGSDRIVRFEKSDLLVINDRLPDGNNDGVITFSGKLDFDGSGRGSTDAVTIGGVSGKSGLRFLGEKDGLFGYATADVRPEGAIEGGFADDVLQGDAANAKRDVFFLDSALQVDLGRDTIRNFGSGDILVTTTRIADGNGDGVIDFGKDKVLNLDVADLTIFTEKGAQARYLEFDGAVSHDGVEYFVYSLQGSSAGLADLHL